MGYNRVNETMETCMVDFRLHRRHSELIWDVYSGQTLPVQRSGDIKVYSLTYHLE